MRRTVAIAALSFLACGPRASETSGLSGGSLAVSSSSSGDGSTSTATTTTTTTSSSTGAASTSVGSDTAAATGPKIDMGIPDLPSDQACNRKVDLVFVIGQHAYYHEHLDVLYGSYPGFIEAMQEVFADIDLHVMVVTGDGEWGDQEFCPKSMCPADGGCPAYGEDNDYPCWALYEDGALSDCDNTHGAGVVFPAGEDASNKPCGLPEGRRYLEGDEPLFAERFDCIARLGGTGGWFQYGWAIGEAVSVDLQEGCNAGFLREDALLFAVLLTSHDSSPYNPYAWAQRVLEAKGFNQDLVVALGYGWDGGAVEPKLCEPQFPDDGPGAVYSWLEHFDHSFFGSICAPSYVSPFVEAATVAAELCEGGPG